MYVLVVTGRNISDKPLEWYFENHAHFLRAKKLAQDYSIYVDERKDFLTELHEFENFLVERFPDSNATLDVTMRVAVDSMRELRENAKKAMRDGEPHLPDEAIDERCKDITACLEYLIMNGTEPYGTILHCNAEEV